MFIDYSKLKKIKGTTISKIPPNFLLPTNFRNSKNIKRLIKILMFKDME